MKLMHVSSHGNASIGGIVTQMVSQSKDGKRRETVTHISEAGKPKRSITRHERLVNGKWEVK